MRNATADSVSVTIIPHTGRSVPEQEKLRAFSRTIVDFKDLPNVMEDATHEMGLTGANRSGPRSFSRDVLSVEITGPNRPHL
jgi:hypothetical protein